MQKFRFLRPTSKGSTILLRSHRSALLDCIRTLAIISVLIYHVATRYSQADMDAVALWFRRYGLLGVDVFFPLSGFLIVRFLLIANTPELIRTFFMRRFFRIVPLYFLAVTIFLLLSLIIGIEREIVDRIWINYFFLTGWFIFLDGSASVPYTITWSLSVEEFAYIVFGIFALIRHQSLLSMLVLTAIFSSLLRLYLNIYDTPGVYNFPLARLDSIAIGGIVAIMMGRGLRGLSFVLAFLALIIYAAAIFIPEMWSTLKYSFIAFGTCSLIVFFEDRLSGWGHRFLQPFASIGFYSYFTYLFHIFNIFLVLKVWNWLTFGETPPFWGVVLVTLIVTHFQAVLSFRIFEGPILSWGRSLEKRN